MSRFDDLDHRLGHHEGRPNPDCSICNPDALRDPTFTAGPWEHSGLGAPAFPQWGDLWMHRGELLVFTNPSPPGDKHSMGGFWMPVYWPLKEDKLHTISEIWAERVPGEVQLELSTGKWNLRTKNLKYTNTLPDEAGLSSPLGVNLIQWAEQQNHAKLIVEMGRKRMFPISEIVHDNTNETPTRLTLVRSAVRCIEIQPLEAFLSDVSLR